MTKEEHIKHWIDSAENDLETANILFNSGRYDWCLFIAHLVIEKLLRQYLCVRIITEFLQKHIIF